MSDIYTVKAYSIGKIIVFVEHTISVPTVEESDQVVILLVPTTTASANNKEKILVLFI